MIISSILLLLLSNAVTLRRDKSILYSRISMIILIYSCLIGCFNLDWYFLENGIDLFGGSSNIYSQRNTPEKDLLEEVKKLPNRFNTSNS